MSEHTEAQKLTKATWIGIIITVAIAVAGWTIAGVDKLGSTGHSEIKQGLAAEKEARITADNALAASIDKIAENTRDLPGMAAELKIALNKLGLDGGR